MSPEEEKRVAVDDHRYMKGIHNTGIRWYYYLENGLNILNAFRNLFLGIFAIYITFKLTNIFWFPIIFLGSCIILIIVGWYNVHKLAKMKEWLGMRFSTHYGIRSFDYQRGTYEELVRLNKFLSKDK